MHSAPAYNGQGGEEGRNSNIGRRKSGTGRADAVRVRPWAEPNYHT